MGEALGKGLLAAFLVFCFMALTGGITLISGIVALFVRGVAKTVAVWIFGISLGFVFSSAHKTSRATCKVG